MMKTPAKAIGIDPMHSHSTSGQRTVRRRMWTPPPIGFITIAATRSDDTAAVGLIPKKITQDRRHQGAAAHPGHPDREANDRTREDDAPVDVHRPSVRPVRLGG